MALFQVKWLRRFVRRHTTPIPMDNAELWKRRLSIAYMLIAWQAFGLVIYMVYTGRNDWPKYYGLKTEEESKMQTGARHYAKLLNIEKGKIIRFSGFKKIGEEEISTDNKPSSDSN